MSGKSRGKRGIVIGAMMEEGVILHCSRALVSGYRDALDDYHRDMDSVVFEEWLQTSITLMQSFANGRHVIIVMDKAPYHSRRVIEKISTASSRKQGFVAYLRSNGVEVAEDRIKAELLEEAYFLLQFLVAILLRKLIEFLA
ncbi:hypothetical protein ANCDUO_13265 [Ancylostoma duodenale]|uniref:Tc1-like transposase DDE domain-containing protein n=1 Tax=Ancylostoma duodenale TaxID=51022 RepID=A0A0C2GCF7_9BILA|nr:hypothetical protein ANCDUO_13265 [Ancylostoma duodenale]